MTSSNMSGETETIGSFFDGIAATYDRDTDRNGWKNLTIFRETLGRLSIMPRTVLDLGAGTGSSIGVILEATQPTRVVAVDASQGMLSQLVQKFPNDVRIVPVQSEVASYPDRHDRESFDLVTAISLMHFIPDQQIVMNGVARCLNTGGRFVFTYAPRIDYHPTQGAACETMPSGISIFYQAIGDIRAMVHESGMRVVDEALYSPRPSADPATIAGMMVVENGVY